MQESSNLAETHVTRFLPLYATLALSMRSGASQVAPDLLDTHFADVAARRAASGKPWLEFLRSSALYVGNYSLKKGATDPQSPHAEDEVYYVVAGKARFTAGSGAAARTVDARTGSILFVKAGVTHEFHDVEEDLDLLVFFSTATPAATRAEVDDVLRRYEQAYNAKDAAALARVYTEDGVFASASGPVVRGRAELEKFWSRAMGGPLTLVLEEFETRSGSGWASGTWALAAAGTSPAANGRFAVGLRREKDGVWRMSFDTASEATER